MTPTASPAGRQYGTNVPGQPYVQNPHHWRDYHIQDCGVSLFIFHSQTRKIHKEFHWITYVFGAFLIFTGIRMAMHKNEEMHPERNPLVKLLRRVMPVTENYEGDKFFIRRAGTLMATPLFLVLLLVESTDLVFAVDSIPAIFAVTNEPFIVYTSNVFAILGLRSLYFLLAGVVDKFHYLKPGLSMVLVFVGIKMVLVDFYKIPVGLSLGVIAAILATSIVASLLRARRLHMLEKPV